MNTPAHHIHAAVLALATLVSTSAGLRAQGGSLTPPPGPPAPVMRTLDEIYNKALPASTGSRINLNEIPSSGMVDHLISGAGSFVLTEHVGSALVGEVGIEVASSAGLVTIDLNGHMIWAGDKGINVTGQGTVVIRNGFIRGGGVRSVAGSNVILQDVTIFYCSDKAVELGGGGTLERVTIKGAVGHGIYVSGSDPVIIRDCRVTDVTNATAGISAPKATITGTTVADITGSGLGVAGIYAVNGRVESCTMRNVQNIAATNGHVWGIEAASVLDCDISELNGSSTINPTSAIVGARLVSRCSANTIQGPLCTVIIGDVVADCHVSYVMPSNPTSLTGISGRVISRCSVKDVRDGLGIAVARGGNASHCSVDNCQKGISCDTMCLVSDNSIKYCTQAGIVASTAGASRIMNNVVSGLGSLSLRGIHSTGGDASFFEGNMVSNCVTGYQADATSSTIFVRNTATADCTTKFDIPVAMVVVTPATMGTNPNANIAQ